MKVSKVCLVVCLCSLYVLARKAKEDLTIQPTQIVKTLPSVDLDAFAVAELEAKANESAKAAQKISDSIAAVQAQKEADIISSGNATDHRAIIIDPKSDAGKTIDSFDKDIASLRSRLYANVLYKKTIQLTNDEQIEYMHWLLMNKYADTSSVRNACELLRMIHDWEIAKLTTMQSVVKNANDKAFLQYHIRQEQEVMGKFGSLVFLLTNKVGY